MKAKPIIGLLIVLMICIVSSISQGADRFYYGTYGGCTHPSILRDSLRFNIVTIGPPLPGNICQVADSSLRAIVSTPDSVNCSSCDSSPTYWSRISHYTLWEAEGYLNSYFGFTYNGGSWVEGGKARYFRNPLDTAGLIQTGPGYTQESGPHYTAEFRLKSPLYFPSGKSGGPPVKLCSLMVVGNGQVLAQKMVYNSDFNNWIGYKSFNIEYDTIQNPIEFQIYWFGNRQLYIDYVKTYDDNGRGLIGGEHDTDIKSYVSQSWVTYPVAGTGDPVVYRWYLRDEPRFIDCYEPFVYINNLLKSVSPERVGFQAFNLYHEPGGYEVHEYLLRANPKDYSIDPYPTRLFGHYYSGEEYQAGWDTYVEWLKNAGTVADSLNKDFWVTVQAYYSGKKVNDPNSCKTDTAWFNNIPDTGWYCSDMIRLPTPTELRLQTFLALCYGANAILNFCYYSYNQYIPAYGGTYLMLGLQDCISEDTAIVDCKSPLWREITDFTGPRVQKLGPIFNQLTWEGACFHDSVGSFVLRNGQESHIDNILKENPHHIPAVQKWMVSESRK